MSLISMVMIPSSGFSCFSAADRSVQRSRIGSVSFFGGWIGFLGMWYSGRNSGTGSVSNTNNESSRNACLLRLIRLLSKPPGQLRMVVFGLGRSPTCHWPLTSVNGTRAVGALMAVIPERLPRPGSPRLYRVRSGETSPRLPGEPESTAYSLSRTTKAVLSSRGVNC